ncbi:MAG: Rne/Rng family ribonuclease [Bacteroidetes bacterium]|nr:Rne/Rng family ribonuclease [Bacteroidota bacterium]
MKKEIIINSTENGSRVAITEEGKLAELFVDSPDSEKHVGDIYLGRVAKVMPGIKAAFIDVGMKNDAFLHFSDIADTQDSFDKLIEEGADVDDDDDIEDEKAPTQKSAKTKTEKKPQFKKVNLVTGKEIIVQITKEPVGKKGVRVTSEVSLPGRYLVLLPFSKLIGVSKRISNFKEKRRLRKLVKSILPSGFGVIIRTNAAGEDEKLLLSDLKSLIDTWKEIEETLKGEKPPTILYKDVKATSSVMRDLFNEDIVRLVIDNKKMFREIKTYVKQVAPNLLEKLEFYNKKEPVFDAFGIEKEISRSLSRKVWLKSGGYIIIDIAEAMTVIDVNSGRFSGKQEQELNSLKTNLESAREIARQIRLRDLGGIIIIDFIDLQDEKNKKKIYDEVRKELSKDRAKATMYPLTELSIMQITRQRIRQNVLQTFSESCPSCGGSGMIQSKSTILSTIERWLRRFKSETKEHKLTLKIHPSFAEFLKEGLIKRITKLQLKHMVFIRIEIDKTVLPDEFKFISRKQNHDITQLYNS